MKEKRARAKAKAAAASATRMDALAAAAAAAGDGNDATPPAAIAAADSDDDGNGAVEHKALVPAAVAPPPPPPSPPAAAAAAAPAPTAAAAPTSPHELMVTPRKSSAVAKRRSLQTRAAAIEDAIVLVGTPPAGRHDDAVIHADKVALLAELMLRDRATTAEAADEAGMLNIGRMSADDTIALKASLGLPWSTMRLANSFFNTHHTSVLAPECDVRTRIKERGLTVPVHTGVLNVSLPSHDHTALYSLCCGGAAD